MPSLPQRFKRSEKSLKEGRKKGSKRLIDIGRGMKSNVRLMGWKYLQGRTFQPLS